MKKFLTATVLVMLPASVLAAVNCSTTPSCEDLGYVFTAADCSSTTAVKCPFDTTKLFCNVKSGPKLVTKDLSWYTNNGYTV